MIVLLSAPSLVTATIMPLLSLELSALDVFVLARINGLDQTAAPVLKSTLPLPTVVLAPLLASSTQLVHFLVLQPPKCAADMVPSSEINKLVVLVNAARCGMELTALFVLRSMINRMTVALASLDILTIPLATESAQMNLIVVEMLLQSLGMLVLAVCV